MKCEKCDSPLPEGATFCGICGATAPVQNVPGAQPMYQGITNQTLISNNKLLILSLCL